MSIRRLLDIIIETTQRGGNSDSIVCRWKNSGADLRAQQNLRWGYAGEELLKDIHVYVDSPMAIAATEVFRKRAGV